MAAIVHSKPSPKSALVDGAVRPWHVIFLFSVAVAVGSVSARALTRAESEWFRPIALELATQLIYSATIFALVVIVPEFRRCLPALFAPHLFRRSRGDLLLALALMLCWGYGFYRVLCWPVVLEWPSANRALGFQETLGPFEARYVLFLLGTVIVAPIAEELVFRGFLLNLWIRRWGVGVAVLASSVVFGLFHLEKTIFAAGMGVIFALIYLRYDSLWPSIVLHGIYNLLAFPWLLGQFFFVKPSASMTNPGAWLPEIVLATAFVPLSLLFWRRFVPRG